MASKVLNDIEKLSNKVQKSLTPKNSKVNINHLVSGLLLIYAVLVAPMLPKKSVAVLRHTWLRVVIIILIALVCLISPVNALLLAIGFVITLNRLTSVKADNVPATNNAVNTKVVSNNVALNNVASNNNDNDELMNMAAGNNSNNNLVNANANAAKNVANKLNNNVNLLKNNLGNAPKNVVNAINNVSEQSNNVVVELIIQTQLKTQRI